MRGLRTASFCVVSLASLVLVSGARAQAPGRAGPAAECSIQQPEVGGIYVANLWPGGVVPYSFNANVSEEHKQVVLAAMAELESVCGCDFVERTNQTDYVRYQNGTGNNSYVGRKGGLQVVNIANWTPDTLLHESMHALGCWHEQQRADRDQFVVVLGENIEPGQEQNFDIKAGTVVGWYDFHSTMHYDRFSWTKTGEPTISARPEYVQFERWLSRKSGLTSGDRWVLTEMYGGDKPPGAFTQVSPPDGAAVGSGWAPSFAWNSSDLADTYRLRVADNPGFAGPVIDVQTNETVYQGGVLKDGEAYYWTVEAINAFGSTSVWPLDTQVLYTGSVPPPVVYVDAASPGGDGASWQTAFTDLADALGAAAGAGGSPVELRIAQGRYTPDRGTGDREAGFELRAGMTVRGGFGGVQNPGDPDQTGFVTILDGDLAGDDGPNFENYGDNALHVVTALWQFESPVVLEDVEIAGGNANASPGYGYMRRGAGGGLLAERADIRVSGCLFRSNSAYRHGAGVAAVDADFSISGCRFEHNAQSSGDYSDGGGAISAFHGARRTVVQDTDFESNEALQGAAIYAELTGLHLDGCSLTDNRADMWSGIVIYDGTDVDIRSCRFIGNSAASVDPGGGEGGAINTFRNSKVLISNSLFAGNTAAGSGGALWTGLDSDLTVVNCTFSLNSAPLGGAVATSDGYGGHSTTTIANAILYGDEGGEIANIDGGATNAAYSDIQGGYAGFANIDADPQFDGTFSPASGSPVNDAGLNGVLDGEITEDVYGAPRVSDDPKAPGGMVIDMGAVEFGPACPPDLDGNGTLDLFDFLAFVNLFNAGAPGADCDHNGGYDLFDFLCFVNAFNAGC